MASCPVPLLLRSFAHLLPLEQLAPHGEGGINAVLPRALRSGGLAAAGTQRGRRGALLRAPALRRRRRLCRFPQLLLSLGVDADVKRFTVGVKHDQARRQPRRGAAAAARCSVGPAWRCCCCCSARRGCRFRWHAGHVPAGRTKLRRRGSRSRAVAARRRHATSAAGSRPGIRGGAVARAAAAAAGQSF